LTIFSSAIVILERSYFVPSFLYLLEVWFSRTFYIMKKKMVANVSVKNQKLGTK
jgi:hypothetical protein